MSIREEILALKDQGTHLWQVDTILCWARANKHTALHAALEWDDAIAGEEWRRSQVRQLIRLHIKDVDRQPQLISLSIDRIRSGGGYRHVDEVLESITLTEIMVADALAELIRVRKKYNHVSMLADVWSSIDSAEELLKRRKQHRRRRRGGGRDRPEPDPPLPA